MKYTRYFASILTMVTLIFGGTLSWPHRDANLPRMQSSAPPIVRNQHAQANVKSSRFLDGVVEGFYGPVWNDVDTRAILQFLSAHHLTAFIYAPKDDPYARAKWNVLYPPPQLQSLGELVQSANAFGISFIYSISPGLTIDYKNPSDLQALINKINQVKALGVNTFLLSFDDIPQQGSLYTLAVDQAQIADAVLKTEQANDPNFRLLFTPTIYWGIKPNAYWNGLKTALAPSIDVMWTGPWVLSQSITATEATAVEKAMGHPVVIWDNYPVNDYTYVQPPHHPHLFLGPVVGRSPQLPQVVAGYFFNPMLQAFASEPALWTGAAYLNNPSHYNPEQVWLQALKNIGAGAPKAFTLFAEANVSSYLNYPIQTPLAQLTAAYWADYRNRLVAYFHEMAGADSTLSSHLANRALLNEIEPWLILFSREGKAGLLAVALLDAQRSGQRVSPAAIAELESDERIISGDTYSLDTTGPVLQFIRNALEALQRQSAFARQ